MPLPYRKRKRRRVLVFPGRDVIDQEDDSSVSGFSLSNQISEPIDEYQKYKQSHAAVVDEEDDDDSITECSEDEECPVMESFRHVVDDDRSVDRDYCNSDREFEIDEEDFLVLRDFLHSEGIAHNNIETEMRKMVHTRGEDHRVYKIRFDSWITPWISSIPSSIDRLTHLERVEISHMGLLRLPDEVCNLPRLKILVLWESGIASLPPAIGKLQSLTELDLSGRFGSGITSLPDEIGNLTNLTKLDLNFSYITALPSSIGRLKNLEILSLSGTHLSQIPTELGKLENLKKLDLSNLGIEKLPESLGRLQNLQVLDLSWTKDLSELPENIGHLKRLEKLTMRNSGIRSIPPSVKGLKNLKHLDLHHAENLTSLPDELGTLKSLEALCLEGTGIKSWPESMTGLSGLRYLYLHNHRQKTRIAELENGDSREFLMSLAKHHPRLGSLGKEMVQGKKDLRKALAHNRASFRGPILDESIRTMPNLWPLVLSRARRLFDRYSDIDGYSNHQRSYKMRKSEALHHILTSQRESFVGLLIDRNRRKPVTKTQADKTEAADIPLDDKTEAADIPLDDIEDREDITTLFRDIQNFLQTDKKNSIQNKPSAGTVPTTIITTPQTGSVIGGSNKKPRLAAPSSWKAPEAAIPNIIPCFPMSSPMLGMPSYFQSSQLPGMFPPPSNQARRVSFETHAGFQF